MTQSSTSGAQPIPSDYSPAADLLAGRVVLVTGAADGLGRATAIAAATHGATVILLDKDIKRMEQVYDEIENAGAPQPAIYPMNLEGAAPNDYMELATVIGQQFGRLDALVLNAAGVGEPSPIDQYDAEVWCRTLHLNVNGSFFLTQACLPLLNASEDARVIFVSDTVGRKGRAFWGAYGVSKFAIEGLMQILADEVEYTGKLRVNSLDPGPALTRLRRKAYPAEPMETLPRPEDLTPAFLYLLGPESRHLHGQALTVPGAKGPSANMNA